MIVAVMLVLGLGGAVIQVSEQVAISGYSLAAIIGIILNKLLPERIEKKD